MCAVGESRFQGILTLIGFMSFVMFVVTLALPDHDGWLWTYLIVYMATGSAIVLIDIVRLPWTYRSDSPDLLLLRPYIWDLFYFFAIPLFPIVGIAGEIKNRREAKQQ